MGSAGKELVPEDRVEEIIDRLDSFYAYEMVAVHWSMAVLNRLEGMALVLLTDEFEKRIDEGMDNAKKLAERIGQLGGAITGDPSRLVALSPVDKFALPSTGSDPHAILMDALRYERLFVEQYGQFCKSFRDEDIVSYDEVVHLLKMHVHREDDIEMALTGPAVASYAAGAR